ncbi:unnamed protein product [Schistocephalus solidus]|uniref:Secreted protein n=1 Tax=Schistocephalus solidus TaxID=70667 RepID=A0A183SLZ4_SCHSO|nr:unnamed protein product [Schistocephalus solidus]
MLLTCKSPFGLASGEPGFFLNCCSKLHTVLQAGRSWASLGGGDSFGSVGCCPYLPCPPLGQSVPGEVRDHQPMQVNIPDLNWQDKDPVAQCTERWTSDTRVVGSILGCRLCSPPNTGAGMASGESCLNAMVTSAAATALPLASPMA